LLLPSFQIPKPPGAHEVDVQHELFVLRWEEEVLASPLRACEAAPLEGRERRVERLESGHVRWSGPLDQRRAHRIVECASKGLHLGKFRHLALLDGGGSAQAKPGPACRLPPLASGSCARGAWPH
jgi:hypothetical protein